MDESFIAPTAQRTELNSGFKLNLINDSRSLFYFYDPTVPIQPAECKVFADWLQLFVYFRRQGCSCAHTTVFICGHRMCNIASCLYSIFLLYILWRVYCLYNFLINFVPVHNKKMCRGVDAWLHLFSILTLGTREWSTLRLGRFTPWKKKKKLLY